MAVNVTNPTQFSGQSNTAPANSVVQSAAQQNVSGFSETVQQLETTELLSSTFALNVQNVTDFRKRLGRYKSFIKKGVYGVVPENIIEEKKKFFASGIDDVFRMQLGAFVTVVDGKPVHYNTVTPYDVFEKVEFIQGVDGPLIRVVANKKSVWFLENGKFNDKKFSDFVKNNTFESFKDFYSSFAEMLAPNDRSEGWQTYPEASAESVYNYFDKGYELGRKNEYVERALPNVNVLAAELQNGKETGTSLDFLVTLVEDAHIDERRICLEQVRNGTYFSNFSKRYDNAVGSKFVDKVQKKQRTFVFSGEDQNQLKSLDSLKNSIPMYIAIDLDTNVSTFSKILEDTKFDDQLLAQLISDTYWKKDQYYVYDTSDPKNAAFQDTRVFDLKAWYDAYDQDQEIPKITIPTNELVYYGEYLKRYAESLSKKDSLERAINWLVFSEKYQQLVLENSRTYQQMLENSKKPYTETVAYRIDKKNNVTGETLQSFYFMNTSKQEVLRYIDSQVKYGIPYRYDIIALQLVIGEKYNYGAPKPGYGKDDMVVPYNCETIVQIVEVSIYADVAQVLDKPSVGPTVRFLPQIGIDNRVKIFVNSSFDQVRLEPVTILNTDAAYWRTVIASQKSKDKKVQFGTDDRPIRFQVFRLDKEPVKWTDFQSGLFYETENNSAIFEDNIEPNITYYYCIRSIDNHNNISMPSNIFKIKVVNDGGTVYMMNDLFEFAEKRKSKKDKSFKRTLSISPAFLQTVLKQEDSGKYTGTGIDDFSIWNKPIRVRITSKNTGRKLDVYCKFTLDDKLVIGKTLNNGVQ